jgi:DNA repair exonuclease SbcCD ATPase subunit
MTQKNTVKQEIKPVILKDGRQIPFKSGLSGGQQSSWELITDLALAEVISERTGFSAGWLVLDEPLDGIDLPGRESIMAVLSKAAEDRAIFVIDHSSETKEFFASVIEIKYEDGRSSIA